MKYFAYGSNCNPALLQKKGVRFTSSQHATLLGYRLLFNKNASRKNLPPGIGFANINVDPTGTVEGILYDLMDDDLERLDASERYPDHYTHLEITVQTSHGSVPCMTYQAQPDKLGEGLKPSRNYLNHLLAAKDFLSWQYHEALDKSQTFEGECACCLKQSEIVFIREGDRLHMLCQPCREARQVWADARGRKLTVAETEAIMTLLVQDSVGFNSIGELIEKAVATKTIDP